MEYTNAKQAMKELTMALLYLSRFSEREKFPEAKDFYVWKGVCENYTRKVWYQ